MKKPSKHHRQKMLMRAKQGMRKTPRVSEPAISAPAILTSYQQITINAPKNLSFRENSAETLDFFSTVRAVTNRPKGARRIIVDPATIEAMDLSGALALVAEFDSWQRFRRMRLAPYTIEHWNEEITARLANLGFFNLLKTQNVPERFKVRCTDSWIPFTTDIRTVGKAAKLLKTRIEKHLAGPMIGGREIYASLVEAMKNAFQHAYPEDMPVTERLSRVGRRWWMAGRVDSTDGIIQITFLDQGVTIPHSLESSWMWQELEHMVHAHELKQDAARLTTAMRYGASRLEGETHRGKGFADIKRPVVLHDANRLQILSRKASFVQQGSIQASWDTHVGYDGTIIEWQLSIPAEDAGGRRG